MDTMNWFVEFFAKYWLTILFGLIAAWLGKKVRHYQQLMEKEKEDKKQLEFKEVVDNVQKYADDKFNDIGKSHEKLYQAVLDVQQKQFQRDCYEYLNLEREISLEEFKNLYIDYNIYTSLGGNGIGSMLFEQVKEKYSNQLFSEKILDATVEKAQQLGAAATQAQTTSTQSQPKPQPPKPPTILYTCPRTCTLFEGKHVKKEAKGNDL